MQGRAQPELVYRGVPGKLQGNCVDCERALVSTITALKPNVKIPSRAETRAIDGLF